VRESGSLLTHSKLQVADLKIGHYRKRETPFGRMAFPGKSDS